MIELLEDETEDMKEKVSSLLEKLQSKDSRHLY